MTANRAISGWTVTKVEVTGPVIPQFYQFHSPYSSLCFKVAVGRMRKSTWPISLLNFDGGLTELEVLYLPHSRNSDTADCSNSLT